jgi:hypothetical protein
MIGGTSDSNPSIGFKRTSGEMIYAVGEGGDASYESLKLSGLATGQESSIGVDADGNVIVKESSASIPISSGVIPVGTGTGIEDSSLILETLAGTSTIRNGSIQNRLQVRANDDAKMDIGQGASRLHYFDNHLEVNLLNTSFTKPLAHPDGVEPNHSATISQVQNAIGTVQSKGASGAFNTSQGNGSWKEFVGLAHKNYGSGIDVLEFSTVPGSSNDKDKRIAFTKTLSGVNNNSYLNQSTLSFEELPATETNSQQYRSGYNIYNSFVEQISYTNSNNYTTRNISVTPEILMFNRSVTVAGNPTTYNNQIRLTSQGYLSCENSYEDMYNPGNDPKIILNREMLGMTSSGDLIVGSTDGIPNRIAKGPIGTVLTVKNDGTVGWNNSSVLTKKQVTITYSTDSAIYSNEIVTPVSGEGNWSVLKMGHPIPDGYKVIKASALLASFSTNSIAEVSFELRRLPMDGSTGGVLSGNSGTLQSTFKIENIPNTSGATKYYKGQCTTLNDTVSDNSMLFCRVLNQSLTSGTGVIINIVLEEV